jgi:hypothetical protein
MSPKATEGVGPTGLGLLLQEEVGAPRAAPPSGLPAISPSRGEISSSSVAPRHPTRESNLPIRRKLFGCGEPLACPTLSQA